MRRSDSLMSSFRTPTVVLIPKDRALNSREFLTVTTSSRSPSHIRPKDLFVFSIGSTTFEPKSLQIR